jgi:hypothetical protein
MKTKRKGKKQRKYTRRGGASQTNIENWDPQNENLSQPTGLGYMQNPPNYSLKKIKPLYERAEDRGYEANIEDYDDNNYDEYIEDLILNNHPRTEHGCSVMTLQERLDAIQQEIQHVSANYNKLIQGIADETLGEFISSGSLKKSYSKKTKKWYKNASKRASIYQQTSRNDLMNAFLYLLPSYDYGRKFFILDQNKKNQSPMTVMVQKYEYKMVTELFTKANITDAVLNYGNPQNKDPYQYLKNLLGLMRDGSQLIHHLLQENWHLFLAENEMGDTRYVHSGGNLILLLAGVICYLYDKRNSPDYVKGTYENNILEDIRKDMDDSLTQDDAFDDFYDELHRLMQDPKVRELLKGCTSNISDMDFILMTKDDYVENIERRELFSINELSVYVLNQIVVLAHRENGSPWINQAKSLLTFAGRFNEKWQPYMFINKSGVTPRTMGMMTKPTYALEMEGYRQTSNKIIEVPMYLNRIKQGYAPFYEIPTNISSNLQSEYATKYGECIDLSIGARTNSLYKHKQDNFKMNLYYSINTLLEELSFIIIHNKDDKTPKRIVRHGFLESINNPFFNTLFLIIGNKIT